jgi:UDP-N-acetylmuramate dehydrogenase
MQTLQQLENQLNTLGIPVRRDVALAPYTTFHIGGPITLMIEPPHEDALVAALRAVKQSGVFSLVLGRGSNVLFPDEGIKGVAVRTCAVRNIEIEGSLMTATCGATLAEIARTAQKAALTGLEFAHGIPGTLGGALYMNAGAYGGEMSQVIRSVRLYDTERDEIITMSGEQMEFSYRHSIVQSHPEWTVLSATMVLTQDDPEAIEARMQDYMQRRRDKQPLEYPSAGSTFKRPANAYAGQLIEQSGLKGYRIGGAMVSPKHAGFIINTGGATALDVRRLIEHVRATVLRDHGIELESEVQILTAHLAR